MPEIDAVKERLIDNDENFRRLFEEHQASKLRLAAIRQKVLHSQEDEVEMKRIKLHKLALKDQMEAILRQHETAVA